MHDRQSDAVATPALRELFTEGLQKYHIIFFSAPCGFGKTTTASLLLEDHTVCEHSALHPDTLKQQIGNSCDTVLIDDLQLLREEEDQQILCRRINEYPGLHFILLSRGVLPGYLIPYQLTGALMSIESEQLRFDSDTTAELLLRGGIRPTAEELDAIQNDSTGYPLAVSVVKQLMTGNVPYSENIADEARRRAYFHYETAVYRCFELPMRQLLIRLAPFTTFDAELAKMVSGDSHVNDLLSRLLHETTMLQFDSVKTYHFWPFFRGFLLWEMEQECTTEQQNDIYRRAGLFYELRDDFARAMDCYSRSGDHRKISELLIKNAELHPGAAHYYDMEKYYYALPREDILCSPALMCGMSMLTAICTDYEVSERWYRELQNYTACLKKSDAEYSSAKSKLIYLDIALPQRGCRGLIELIGTVFRAVTDKSLKLSSFSVTSCLPSIMNGGKDFCEWSKSDDLIYQTMRLPVETVLGKDGVGLADCAICESKFEKGEDVSSRVLTLMSRMSEIERKGTPDIVFAAMGLLVRTQVMQGKAQAALDALDNVKTDFMDSGQTRFLPNIDAMRCRVLLRLGNMNEALRWLKESAPSSVPHFRVLWRYRYMTKAMVQIADDKPDEALLSIAPLLPYSEKCGRTMDGIYLRLLMAICHYRQKNRLWETELSAALDTMHAYRFITPAAQYGAAVLPLLNACRWDKDPAFFARLLNAVREQTVFYPDFLRPAVILKETLTPAETQVLRLLCTNRSNQEIADILGVKLPTVKSQVRSILQKLNVKRRSEAKEAAQELHLV